MSDIERRPASRPSRKKREERAFRLVLASGGFGVAAVVALVLTIAGVIGGGWFVILAVLAVVSALMLRRTLRP
jgi:hypothetical protein